MRKNKLWLLGSLSLSLNFGVQAQQLPVMNHYIYNPYLYNPARTGQNEFGSVNLNFKKQWVSLPYSPLTGSITAEAPLPYANMGLGGMLYTDRMHIINKTGGMLSYAYHVPFSKTEIHRLSAGLSLGFINQRFDFQEARVANPNDNQLLPSQANATAFDFSMGLDYQWRSLHVGLSMLQGLNNQLRFLSNAGGEITYLNTRHFLAQSSYRFELGESNNRFYVEPTLLLRMIQGLPVQVEFNALVGWRKLLWAGLGYRSSNNQTSTSALMATFGIELQRQIFLAYTFEFGINGGLSAAMGSQHELMVAYRFGQTFKNRSSEEAAAAKLEALENRLEGLKANQLVEREAQQNRLDSLERVQKELSERIERQTETQKNMEQVIAEQQDLKQKLKDQENRLNAHEEELAALRDKLEKNRYAFKKLGEVYFGEAKTQLDAESRAKLDALVQVYQRDYASRRPTIYLLGFGSKTGDAKVNERISTQRTLAVRQYLVSKGLAGDQLIIVPNGKTDSQKTNNTEDRRVDILISDQ